MLGGEADEFEFVLSKCASSLFEVTRLLGYAPEFDFGKKVNGVGVENDNLRTRRKSFEQRLSYDGAFELDDVVAQEDVPIEQADYDKPITPPPARYSSNGGEGDDQHEVFHQAKAGGGGRREKAATLEKLSLTEAIALSTMYPTLASKTRQKQRAEKRKSWIRVPDLALEGCLVKSAKIEVRLKREKPATGNENAIQRAIKNVAVSHYTQSMTLDLPWPLSQAHKALQFSKFALEYLSSWQKDSGPRTPQDVSQFLDALLNDMKAARNAFFEHDPLVFPSITSTAARFTPTAPDGIIVQFMCEASELVVSTYSIVPADLPASSHEVVEVDDLFPFEAGNCHDYASAAFSTSSVNSLRKSLKHPHSTLKGKLLAYPSGHCVRIVDFDEVRFRIDAFSNAIGILAASTDMLEAFMRNMDALRHRESRLHAK